MRNALHHDRKLSNLNTDVNYRRLERAWARRDNGYCPGSNHHRDACRRYNKAFRKASKVQLSRYSGKRSDAETPEDVLPESNSWVDDLAAECREEYWADKRFNDYCEEYDDIMQPVQ